MLTPPHSTSARSYDNLHYHNYDLVAISMGTGGWVLLAWGLIGLVHLYCSGFKHQRQGSHEVGLLSFALTPYLPTPGLMWVTSTPQG